MASSRVSAIEAYSIDVATLTGGCDLLCPGLDEPCFLIRIINLSDRVVGICYKEGLVSDYVPTGQTIQLNLQTNSLPPNKIAVMGRGQKLWVTGTAGTGYIYLAGYYME